MKVEPIVRLATSADVVSIRQCVDSAYSQYISRIGRRPAPMDADYQSVVLQGRVFVVEAANNELAGVLVMQHRDGRVLLESIAVFPCYQGLGFGVLLLQKSERYALEKGADKLYLYTHVLMSENIALYTQKGYTALKRVSEEGFERLYMCKLLS